VTELSPRFFSLFLRGLPKGFGSAASRAALFLASVGCSSGTSSATTHSNPSILEVSPEEFSDDVPCAPGGGLRQYVATLWDVTPKHDLPGTGGAENSGGASGVVVPFALPSSLPTRCEQGVGFGWVISGHSYYATVEGYDRDDLDVLAPGIPIVVDRATREPVKPRWVTSCGSQNEPVRAESQATRRLTDCENWRGDTPQTPTRVQVDISDALGQTACGAEAGFLDSFSVRRDGVIVGSAACGEQVVLEDLVPQEFVSLDVLGYEAGATAPRFGTSCTATALSGVTLQATCEPLSETGTLAIDVDAALDAMGTRCDSDLASLVLDLGGGVTKQLTLGPNDCRGTAHFFDLVPGDYTVTITAQLKQGEPLGAECSASVEPGLASEALCEKL
jgi:hypothetical protein